MTRALVLAAPLALLGACSNAAGSSETPPAPPAADACHAAGLARYVGAVPSADVMAAITAAAGAENIRTIRPGDAVTMDYREERLNVELGEDGRIKRLRCG